MKLDKDIVKKRLSIVIFIFLVLILALLLFAIYAMYFYDKNLKNANKKEVITEKKKIEVVSPYNNPIIPEGFKKVETEEASWELDEEGNPKGWNDGLVIEDDIGNQFVWVPCEDKKATSNESIIKYSGFYIARYEAGLPEELSDLKSNISEETNNIKGKPVSKKGAIPWNYIDINNAYYNAENMYEKNSNFETKLMEINVEDLIIYVYWLPDEVIRETSLYSNSSSSKFYFTGYYSTDDGKNYSYGENVEKNGNMLLSTGASERNKFKNIYDYYGNVSEACLTKISEFGYIYATTEDDSYKNNYHYGVTKEVPFYYPNPTKGFRVVLLMY